MVAGACEVLGLQKGRCGVGEVPTGEDSLPVLWRLQDCAMIS